MRLVADRQVQFKMATKKLSNSRALTATLLHAAFQYLATHGRSAPIRDIKAAISPLVAQNEWAVQVIESNGLARWETYLHFFSVTATKAGFISKSKGVWTLSDSGVSASRLDPTSLIESATSGYNAWRKAQLGASTASTEATVEDETESPPEERMAAVQSAAEAGLAAELLERVLANTPEFFERLVLILVQKMGYGGWSLDAIQHTGRTGDGGIDGIIHEDALGLDQIYLQAKRYKGSVQVNEVRDFIGALATHGVRKGVFITTGRFADNAKTLVKTSQQQRIALIDGPYLAALMIKHGIGVSPFRTFNLKRVDGDWFDEE
jgi:restriction system protein